MHPDVQAFKTFINQHPKLIESIRRSGHAWQPYYEKWILLGEDDPYWDAFKSPTNQDDKNEPRKQTEMIEQLKKFSETVDLNKIQGHAQQLSGTIGTIQELISQFQSSKNPQASVDPDASKHPEWFKD
nr:YlbD family protein [Lentibacillus sp. JNUCC-1]